MYSTFWRGLTLLQESNSLDTEVGWNQGPLVASLSPSKDIEDGFTEVPKLCGTPQACHQEAQGQGSSQGYLIYLS